MGFEVDAQILEAYAKMLIDAPIAEAENSCGIAKQKSQEIEIEFKQKKREKKEGKERKFVQKVSQDIKELIDVVLKKGGKRKNPKVHIDPLTIESKSKDDTPLAFKRVVRKKIEETKVEAKKQPVRKVTFKIPSQKQAPKLTTSAAINTTNRKSDNDTDTAIHSGNVPPKTCTKLVDEITKDGMLKNVQFYYDHLEDDEQRDVEEGVLLYLDIYKKALIEIENEIPRELYNMLDARRLSTMQEGKHIKIQELLFACVTIAPEEMERTLEVENIKVFNRKHRITSVMLGRVKEIIKDIEKEWVKFFGENRGLFTSPKSNSKILDTLVEGKGKGIMGTTPSILKNIKIVEIKPLIDTNIQTDIEILANRESKKVNDVQDDRLIKH